MRDTIRCRDWQTVRFDQLKHQYVSFNLYKSSCINKIFDKNFVKAIDLVANCKGKIIAAGIGKSGLIARKFSATCSSVGFPSFYLNPSEANHGDLGQIDRRGDLIVCFSYSGNTVELTNMLKYANRFNIKITP